MPTLPAVLGDVGVERSGKFNHGRDKRKEAHSLLSRSVISSESNPAKDIEGEWEGDLVDETTKERPLS